MRLHPSPLSTAQQPRERSRIGNDQGDTEERADSTQELMRSLAVRILLAMLCRAPTPKQQAIIDVSSHKSSADRIRARAVG